MRIEPFQGDMGRSKTTNFVGIELLLSLALFWAERGLSMHTERTRADEGLNIGDALVESTSKLARTNRHQYDNTLRD